MGQIVQPSLIPNNVDKNDMKFNIDLANTLAKSESHNKHLYRPNTYLHKWWARRCGTTFRSILKYLVEDDNKQDYYSSGGLEGKVILDPMMGGGTTLHEAIRLGANVIGADIDPIPVLQAKASLDQRVSIAQLEEKFHSFYEYLDKNIGELFATDCPECSGASSSKFTLYGIKKSCKCSEVTVVESFTLRHESDGSVISICDKCQVVYKDSHECKESIKTPKLVEKSNRSCLKCNEKYIEDQNVPLYQRYVPLVTVGQCKNHGLFFKNLSKKDQENLNRAKSIRNTINFGNLEEFKVVKGPKSKDLILRNIHSYTDLFSDRHTLYIYYSMKWLEEQTNEIIKLNFAMLISTSLEFNSMLCGYKGGGTRRPGAIRHVFAHHAYTFPFTSLENNPLFPDKRASGSLHLLFDTKILKGRLWAKSPTEIKLINTDTKSKAVKVGIDGELDGGIEVNRYQELSTGTNKFLLTQGSSTQLSIESNSIDFIVTDPPYYDSVQYSDLAAYFRVWLKKMLPNSADWDYDVSNSAVDSDGTGLTYEKLLGLIFSESHRVLKKDDGLLIFTFHHWDYKAWHSLSQALRFGSFKLVNKYVIHSENPSSVHIKNINSLSHDAILILAPVSSDKYYDWELPFMVNKEKSEDFTNDCANIMGWILNSTISSEEAKNLWKELLN